MHATDVVDRHEGVEVFLISVFYLFLLLQCTAGLEDSKRGVKYCLRDTVRGSRNVPSTQSGSEIMHRGLQGETLADNLKPDVKRGASGEWEGVHSV